MLGMNIVMMAWVMITRTVCAQGTKFKFVMCRGGYGGLRTNISVMLIRRYKSGNCQALVPNPKPISPQSPQTQCQPSPTQFETQINPKGTGADTKIL